MAPSPSRCFGRVGRRSPPGFSFVELLVSLAVLALLLVLAFGSFRAMQKKWKLTACASNLRQLGAVLGLYLADHNMTFPPTGDENQLLVGGQKGTFPGYDGKPETRPLNRYVNGDYRVFRCPADVGYQNNAKREQLQPIFEGKTYFEVMGSSYRYNAKDLYGKGSLTKVKRPTNAEMHRLAEIRSPARFIVMGDSDAFSFQVSSTPWWTYWHGTEGPNEGNKNYPRYPIANILFADWHVETVVITDKPSPHRFGDNYHFDIENKP